MEDCKVCWTCKGLFLGDAGENDISTHMKSCKIGNNLQKLNSLETIHYFVCEKSDFTTLNTLKDTLRKHSRKIFSSLHVQKVLPHPLIKILLSLRVSDRTMKQTKPVNDCVILSENVKRIANKNIQKLMENGKVDKECQTMLHTSNIFTSPVYTDFHDDYVKVKDTLVNADVENISSKISPSSLPCKSIPSYVVIVDNTLQDDLAEKLSSHCDILKDKMQSYYVCKLCSHKSKSDQLMLRHLKSHNNGQMFVCSDCKFSTIWRKDWKQHLQRHINKQLQCHICAAKFIKKDELDLHLATFHSFSVEANKFKCSECDYQARNMTSLREHKRKHTGEVFTCPHPSCTFQSMYDRSLQKHLRQKHALEKTEICHICGFQTRHASSLTKHMMLHSDFKPYKCSQCSFTALYPSEIILHAKRKHLKQKRFSCPICSFETSYPWAIQKHVSLHEGKRGYACSVCGEGMETLQKAKKHMMNSHGCENYQILSEPSLKKIKPSDYEIKHKTEVFVKSADLVVRNETVINESVSKKKDNPELVKTSVKEVFLGASQKNDIETSDAADANQYSSKGGNPMLCATASTLNDAENSMTEDSLFDLMSDFPRPPALNRCQSASTLMFASFSPHLIDRPLTPDFFTDSPSVGSFFPNFSSKHLEPDPLVMGSLSSFDNSSHQLLVPQTNNSHLVSSLRVGHPLSPLLASFTNSPGTGTPTSVSAPRLTSSLAHDGGCMDIMLPNGVLNDMSQLNVCNTDSHDAKMDTLSFSKTKSAFSSLGQDYSPEIEAAIAGIPMSDECQTNACLIEESPFPSNTVLKNNMFKNSLL
ncbi:hypothetical protein Btru_047527 [Bulinus truncatus]|nr:hypothetical protein Btru_047527 [Bulinus truncatus]